MNKQETQKFFQLILNKNFKEAEEMLEQIKTKLEKSPENFGYLKALEGLILTFKSTDEKLYLKKLIETTDEKELNRLKNEFSIHVKNELHADYDRGYFKALLDYLNFLKKPKL
ncbi:MAG: hypothetical protein QW476_04825 [Candidatus Bathyarchaeia archaeon]|nr:hypothetical protein [Candidatus Bathyarchaeota archaeon]